MYLLPVRLCPHVVPQVAAKAAGEGRLPILAVLYDEMARKRWEDLSGKLGGAFQVGDYISRLDERVLKDAVALYDQLFKGGPRPPTKVKVCPARFLHLLLLFVVFGVVCDQGLCSGEAPP